MTPLAIVAAYLLMGLALSWALCDLRSASVAWLRSTRQCDDHYVEIVVTVAIVTAWPVAIKAAIKQWRSARGK